MWNQNFEILTTGMQNLFFGDQPADDGHRNFTLGVLLMASTMRQD
jgi:hypothetical protein